MKWVVEASWYSLRRGFDFVRPLDPQGTARVYHHYLRRWRCVPTHPRNSSSFLVTASVRPRGDPPSSSSRAAVIFPSHHRTSAHSSSFHSIELFPNFTRSQPITPSSWHQPTYSQTKKAHFAAFPPKISTSARTTIANTTHHTLLAHSITFNQRPQARCVAHCKCTAAAASRLTGKSSSLSSRPHRCVPARRQMSRQRAHTSAPIARHQCNGAD